MQCISAEYVGRIHCALLIRYDAKHGVVIHAADVIGVFSETRLTQGLNAGFAFVDTSALLIHACLTTARQ